MGSVVQFVDAVAQFDEVLAKSAAEAPLMNVRNLLLGSPGSSWSCAALSFRCLSPLSVAGSRSRARNTFCAA